MSLTATHAPHPKRKASRRTRTRRTTSLFAHGEPLVWLTGGALAVCLAMVFGLIAIVVVRGGATFLVRPVERFELSDGRVVVGQVTDREQYLPVEGDLPDLPSSERSAVPIAAADGSPAAGATTLRWLVRTGNFELTGEHFEWVAGPHVRSTSRPEWSLVFEREEWGRFYGEPTAFVVGGEPTAQGPEAAWAAFGKHHRGVRRRLDEIAHIQKVLIGKLAKRLDDARLRAQGIELREGRDSSAHLEAQHELAELRAETDSEFSRLRGEIRKIEAQNERYALRVRISDDSEHDLPLATIVRAVPANRLGSAGAARTYLARWWEFLSADPRESNSEGGVYPAIIGTVLMTLIMAILVVPFGVLAALYLHEYAKQGLIVSTVRIAVNNLAGVPSIVFGVFGLGFFCYIVGASIDDLFYAERLPNPTYGKGGVLWASLTLALLTLPVVIVATEEALAAVPGSMREGSYACGATKWQTIHRIVLPRALPGILTGTILAIARGAGEVAPLMLVGAVKLAPDLPLEVSRFPYVFPERSFMHLGFHIYDVGFQSQNSEAARPLVFTTTLLLIGIVVLLNVVAMRARTILRRRFQSGR